MLDEVSKASGCRFQPAKPHDVHKSLADTMGNRSSVYTLNSDYLAPSEPETRDLDDGVHYNSRATDPENCLPDNWKGLSPRRPSTLQAVQRVMYCRPNSSPKGLNSGARWLFLRSILLCVLAATLSSQHSVRILAVPQQVHAELRDTRDQGTLQRGYPVLATSGTATHVSIAQALWTTSIFLGGAALVLAALVSVKANAGGPSPDDDKRASRLQYGRTSLQLAAILNLIALIVTSIDNMIAQDILATAKLVIKLAASSALALYSKERLT